MITHQVQGWGRLHKTTFVQPRVESVYGMGQWCRNCGRIQGGGCEVRVQSGGTEQGISEGGGGRLLTAAGWPWRHDSRGQRRSGSARPGITGEWAVQGNVPARPRIQRAEVAESGTGRGLQLTCCRPSATCCAACLSAFRLLNAAAGSRLAGAWSKHPWGKRRTCRPSG